MGNAVDFGERIEVGRIAFEDDGVGEIGVEGDDEKYFTGDLKDEALAPLLHEGRVRQAEGKGAKSGEAQGRGQFKMARTAAPRSPRVKGFAR